MKFMAIRIGGITALLLDLTKVYWLPAPVFIMGVIATVVSSISSPMRRRTIIVNFSRPAS